LEKVQEGGRGGVGEEFPSRGRRRNETGTEGVFTVRGKTLCASKIVVLLKKTEASIYKKGTLDHLRNYSDIRGALESSRGSKHEALSEEDGRGLADVREGLYRGELTG